MRREERSEAGAADDVEENGGDLVGGVLVEIAGRLVAEQHARRVGESADEGDALLLAALGSRMTWIRFA
jgi:hypothetical protein